MLENNQENKLILLKDLGMRYPTEKSKRKSRFGLYKCHCGEIFEAHTYDVNSNKTKSCGCLKIIHSLGSHRLYNTWYQMLNRCNNPKSKDYKDYGGRGITVCDRWLDVKNFIEDMYSSFKEGLTVDRIDVNKNYDKENCRWTTKNIQSRNTRKIISTNKSGYRGVSYFKLTNKWVAKIGVNFKLIHIGTFNTAIEAAKAYDKYVIDNKLEHTLNFK